MHLIVLYNQHYEFDWLERCALCRPRPCDNEPRLSAPAVSSTGGCQKMDGCSTVVQKMKLLLYTLDPWTSSNSFSFCLVDNFWSTPRSSVLQGSFSEEFFRLGRPCCFYLFLLIFNTKNSDQVDRAACVLDKMLPPASRLGLSSGKQGHRLLPGGLLSTIQTFENCNAITATFFVS